MPVFFIKLRDYILWLGPLYLAAICLSALTEVIVTRLVLFPTPAPQGSLLREPHPSYGVWWKLIGYRQPSFIVPARLFIWLAIASDATTWTALLMTAALSWSLALLRVGTALILASVLALLVPTFPSIVRETSAESDRMASDAPGASDASLLTLRSIPVQWWQALKQRFTLSSNTAMLGTALGAVVIAAGPGIQSLLRGLDGPVAYSLGAIAGTLTNLVPGADAPLIAALQARGSAGIGTSLMLAVSVAPLGLLCQFKGRFGVKAAGVYLLTAWTLSALTAALLDLLVSVAGTV